MKILGIGVDIVDNKRLRKLIKDKKFINRTFGKKEIELSKRFKDKVNYFAKRFAAKEALSKALGTGFRYNLNFKDIEILNDNLGKPYYLNSVKIDQFIKKIYKKLANTICIYQFPMKKNIQWLLQFYKKIMFDKKIIIENIKLYFALILALIIRSLIQPFISPHHLWNLICLLE